MVVQIRVDTQEETSDLRAVQKQDSQAQNCFMLIGAERKISKKEVGAEAIWDYDLKSWCFIKKVDAQQAYDKLKGKCPNIKVQRFYSEIVKKTTSGSRSAKKAVKKRCALELKKDQLIDADISFSVECNKLKVDRSYLMELDDKTLNEPSNTALKKLKEQANKLELSKTEIFSLEEECDELEIIAESELNHPSVNFSNWAFKVLGYNNKREILIWHKGEIMSIPVKQLGESDVKLLVGIDAPYNAIKDAIIDQAREAGKINDGSPIKCGVWRIKNKWIIISGHHVAVIENGSLRELADPVFEGKIIEHSNSEWLDWEMFKQAFKYSCLNECFAQIQEKVKTWNWINSEMADYASAFIMLNPFQHGMSWRPWLYLTGSKGTGKSTFLEEMIQGIFGSLVERLDKSTAHATAQTIGNSNKIAVFDEFEKSLHIKSVLELAKSFNKGGTKTSGTPGSSALKYDLHHMSWFGSIYLPLQISQDAAQESRMVKLELKKLNPGIPLFQKIEDSQVLSGRIVGSMLHTWEVIDRGAKEINRTRSEIFTTDQGIEIRTVENFMYASALLNHLNPEASKRSVPSWAIKQIEDDCDKILSTILSSILKTSSVDDSIITLIRNAKGDQTGVHSKALENAGIKHTSRDGNSFVAFRCESVSRFLLKDTSYRDLDIQAPLSRTPGAISSHPVKFSGSLGRCVLIPLNYVLGKD